MLMTPGEQEFAVLIDNLNSASQQLRVAEQQAGDKPQHHNRSGYITPSEVADYKISLAQYDQTQQNINQAKEAVEIASAAIDNWLPEDLRKSTERVAISAPVLGGHVMLSKSNGKYMIFNGKSAQDAQEKLSYHLAMRR